jgi:hypothetical protein
MGFKAPQAPNPGPATCEVKTPEEADAYARWRRAIASSPPSKTCQSKDEWDDLDTVTAIGIGSMLFGD